MVPTPPPLPGLCAACAHGVLLRTARAAFLRCARSDREASFPRYPRVPVLACPGFEPRAAVPDGGETPPASGSRR